MNTKALRFHIALATRAVEWARSASPQVMAMHRLLRIAIAITHLRAARKELRRLERLAR